jgi:hypothetical protein
MSLVLEERVLTLSLALEPGRLIVIPLDDATLDGIIFHLLNDRGGGSRPRRGQVERVVSWDECREVESNLPQVEAIAVGAIKIHAWNQCVPSRGLTSHHSAKDNSQVSGDPALGKAVDLGHPEHWTWLVMESVGRRCIAEDKLGRFEEATVMGAKPLSFHNDAKEERHD